MRLRLLPVCFCGASQWPWPEAGCAEAAVAGFASLLQPAMLAAPARAAAFNKSRRVVSLMFFLEVDSCGELKLPLWVDDGGDDAGGGLSQRSVGQTKLRRVEEVESFGANLQAGSLDETDLAREA